MKTSVSFMPCVRKNSKNFLFKFDLCSYLFRQNINYFNVYHSQKLHNLNKSKMKKEKDHLNFSLSYANSHFHGSVNEALEAIQLKRSFKRFEMKFG